MGIDCYKVRQWANAKKLDKHPIVEAAFKKENINILSLCDILGVKEEQITEYEEPEFLYRSANEFMNSKKEVYRDNIHFYNYYEMVAPLGYVNPVVLDILCPNDRLPKLNNGHLEPALTINLGPGAIFGRWHENIALLDAYKLLEASTHWVCGDSYFESSFNPHAYHLASETPARILSFTVNSPLKNIIHHSNCWSDERFERLVSANLLETTLKKHGLSQQDLNLFDYRLFFEKPLPNCDSLSKIHMSVSESMKTIRDFYGYTIASAASCNQYMDVCALFMLVYGEGKFVDYAGNTYYLVMDKNLTFVCGEQEIVLDENDSLWVGPHAAHSFKGNGSLIKLHDGYNYSSLDQFQMNNIGVETLKKARLNDKSWNN